MAATNYSPIQLYYSTTASAAPAAGNLVSGELAINITDGKLYYKDNAGTVQLLSTSTTANGTANGVLYLNGSKVATSGSALTFDGVNLATNTGGTNATLGINSTSSSIYLQSRPDISYSRLISSAYPLDLTTVANQPISFGVNNTEQMRLTSTGLGIGTSSPGYKLDVNGTAAFAGATVFNGGANTIKNTGELQWKDSGGTAQNVLFMYSDNNVYLSSPATSSSLIFRGVGYAERMRLDSSGNLGLGVTPSGHLPAGYGGPILQVGGRASILGSATTSAYTNNTYYAAGYFRYIGNDEATMLEQIDGAFKFYTAASGTAGDAISFTQALTLGSDGNLLVGTTSGSWTGNDARIYSVVSSGWAESLYTTGSAGGTSIMRVDNTGAKFVDFRYTSTNVGSITTNGTITVYSTTSDYRLKNVIGNVTGSGARIDALEPIEYEWKASGERTRGFLAHKFQEVYPQSVSGEKDAVDENGNPKYQQMQASTSEVIADLVAEIQSLRKRLADAGIA